MATPSSTFRSPVLSIRAAPSLMLPTRVVMVSAMPAASCMMVPVILPSSMACLAESMASTPKTGMVLLLPSPRL